MTNQHPITPPPELLQEWCQQERNCSSGLDALKDLATQAARWGADQELEACCSEVAWLESTSMAKKIRAARRPKPPTLKEQALDALREAESTGCFYVNGRSDTIRRALEALPND
jgi:hypothetical protein